uniref:Uncharacterized protein n=1 Tax=Rhizophora mucronata TaxID=61149 RepID=A0A2P2Q0B2_RHIMU
MLHSLTHLYAHAHLCYMQEGRDSPTKLHILETGKVQDSFFDCFPANNLFL